MRFFGPLATTGIVVILCLYALNVSAVQIKSKFAGTFIGCLQVAVQGKTAEKPAEEPTRHKRGFSIKDGVDAIKNFIWKEDHSSWLQEWEKLFHTAADAKKIAEELIHCISSFALLKKGKQNEVKNWMNSFLNADVKYGKHTFHVIFDSSNNLTSLPGNFVLGTCPAGMEGTNSQGQTAELSCKRHKMSIYKPKDGATCHTEFTQASYDGTEIKMAICDDKMTFHGMNAKKASFMVLDGDKFNMFDLMLDSGALAAPKIDGVFSLAFSPPQMPKNYNHKENQKSLKSGIEFLGQKSATVFMESFNNLDFFSGTTGEITIGEEDTENCDTKNWQYFNIVDQPDMRWNVPFSASTEWPGKARKNNKTMAKQKAMISTMDIFIFAPEKFTEPLMALVKDVNDNLLFRIGRALGKFGLLPKDVLIKCPKEEEYAKMPTLTFDFGGFKFSLGPKEYILPIVSPKLPIFGNVVLFNWCHMMIRPRPTSGMFAAQILTENNKDDTWIFGQLLFNKACVKFDYANRRVGLTKAVQKTEGSGEEKHAHLASGHGPSASSSAAAAGGQETADEIEEDN